jgi:cytochrome c oxidase subunit 2
MSPRQFRPRAAVPLGLAAALLLPGCSGRQSALAPASPQAELLAGLWWAMLIVAALVTALVLALLLVGLARGRGERPPRPLPRRGSRRLVIGGGIILPVVVVIPFVVSSFSIGRIVDAPAPADALTVEVIGRLWWWEVHYLDAAGERIATTANEIHVPVGRPVRFLLSSDNVIHSFWVPNLQGKMDMIPGMVNTTWFQAEAPGVFRGQCAEFCGTQHALMAFLLVAEPAAQFERWLQDQQRPAREPTTPQAIRGKEVFFAAACDSCHTIRGTPADAKSGPDLTHIGSRRTLAAATIPNNLGYLGGWVADPQHVKPGNLMPPAQLAPAKLNALIRYLESLQ